MGAVDLDQLCDEIAAGLIADGEDLASATGLDPMAAASSLLRPCLVPSPGNLFVTGDLAQIEARMVCFLAGQQDVLDVFARGEDVYLYAARQTFGVERVPMDATKKSHPQERQLGKAEVLGLGFGMGAPKFKDTVAKAPYLLTIENHFADEVVRGWRAANPKIVGLWALCDRAFRAAMRSAVGGGAWAGPKLRFTRYEDRLTRSGTVDVALWLPSGRPLIYRDCRLSPSARFEGATEISYMGVDQKTKRWARIKTYGGSLVENATQAAARDLLARALVLLEVAADRTNMALFPVMTVHDEAVAEFDPLQIDRDRAERIMRAALTGRSPPWAKGLPVDCELAVVARYRK